MKILIMNFLLLMMPLSLVQYQSASADENKGTIRIEGTSVEQDKISQTYNFPKDSIFEISDGNDICPSNQCKLIPDTRLTTSPNGMFLAFSEEGNAMTLAGFYRLQDDITNGHFTPKKQKLVEDVSFLFLCTFDDIQENLENGTTKYLCSDKHSTGFTRTFNNTMYPYTFSASFDLPSKHFVLNATEADY